MLGFWPFFSPFSQQEKVTLKEREIKWFWCCESLSVKIDLFIGANVQNHRAQIHV